MRALPEFNNLCAFVVDACVFNLIEEVPETRNPKPETQNLKPETRNPKPETRNPKPETRSLFFFCATF